MPVVGPSMNTAISLFRQRALVIDTITAGGKDDGPIPQRVFWCIFEGLVAIALLLGGGFTALQSIVVTTS